MENGIEKGPERILTKQEVLEAISRFAEKAGRVVKERSDESGPYLLEVEIDGKNPGETVQYIYTRKGVSSDQNQTLSTTIQVVYCESGEVVGGQSVADFDDKRGEWHKS